MSRSAHARVVAFGASVLAAATVFSLPTSGQEAFTPGPQLRDLLALSGAWDVYVGSPGDTDPVGSAEARARLGDRFVEIEVSADAGPVRHVIYTLSFDDRHGEHAVVMMDNAGTYFVTARGTAEEGGARVAMYGKDDDPVMTSMGLEKEFAIVLYFRDEGFALETRFIDTRTPERTEMPFLKFEFRRPDVP